MNTKEGISRPIVIEHPDRIWAGDAERLRGLARELIRRGKPEDAELVLRATTLTAPDEDPEEGFCHPAYSARAGAAAEHGLVVDYLAMRHDLEDFDAYMRGAARCPETEGEAVPRPHLADQEDDVGALLTVARYLAERGSLPWAETVARVAAQRCPDAAAGRPSQAVRVWLVIEDELEVAGRFSQEEYRRELGAIYDIDTGMDTVHRCVHHECREEWPR